MKLAAFALLLTGNAHTVILVGFASVVDGDTLEIHGQRIRLWGIDAPESSQLCEQNGKKVMCGRTSALALADFIHQKTVSCTKKDTDRYGRIVAICSSGATEINGWLVENGYALAYRQYGGAVYNSQENSARTARRGIWATSFVEPWTYRKLRTTPAATAPAVANTSTPGMFKSCKEARAAGKTPVLRGEPGYNPKLDGDKDGNACE